MAVSMICLFAKNNDQLQAEGKTHHLAISRCHVKISIYSKYCTNSKDGRVQKNSQKRTLFASKFSETLTSLLVSRLVTAAFNQL